MYSVIDLSRAYGVSRSTIKNWSKEFGEYLSKSATGNPRSFTDDDLHVITVVAHLRQQSKGYDVIHEALRAGDRMPPPQSVNMGNPEKEKGMITNLMTSLARFEGELEATKTERDSLRSDLDKERELHETTRQQLMETKERAARAEAERDMMREKSVTWWGRLLGYGNKS